jgi:hypothetical protein
VSESVNERVRRIGYGASAHTRMPAQDDGYIDKQYHPRIRSLAGSAHTPDKNCMPHTHTHIARHTHMHTHSIRTHARTHARTCRSHSHLHNHAAPVAAKGVAAGVTVEEH